MIKKNLCNRGFKNLFCVSIIFFLNLCCTDTLNRAPHELYVLLHSKDTDVMTSASNKLRLKVHEVTANSALLYVQYQFNDGNTWIQSGLSENSYEFQESLNKSPNFFKHEWRWDMSRDNDMDSIPDIDEEGVELITNEYRLKGLESDKTYYVRLFGLQADTTKNGMNGIGSWEIKTSFTTKAE